MICVSESDYKIIKDIIARYAANCEVRAFGSRYKWTSNDYSDLDLAFAGDKKLTLAEIGKIRDAFEESDLPFRVDVLDISAISKEFQAIINQGYEVIYSPPKSIAKGWRKVRLGDVVSTNTSTYSEKENWEYVDYLDTGNITENKISDIQRLYPDQDKLPSRARRKLKKNDIIYSTVRPNQKHYGLMKEISPNLLVSTGFTTITSSQKVDSGFIYYYLTQDDIVTHLQNIAEQSVSAYPSIRPSDIEDLQLVLPPLPTQRTIATTLSCLDDKIELNNRINANLEAQAQAIFKSWFVDFEPFKGGEFVDSELGKIPKGWMIKKLDEICKIKGGKRLPKGVNLITEPNTHPYIRVRDMNNSIFVQNNGTLEYVDDDTQQFISRYIVSGGDIIISIVGTVGLVSKIHDSLDKANLTENCVRLTGFDNIFSDYIYLFLTSKEGQDCIKRGTVGAVQAKLPLKNIQSIPLIIPPQGIICDFHNFTSISMQQLANNLSENAILAAIRDTLLPKLMSGEVSIDKTIGEF
ncbi:restriction endonuclease [Spirochaetia bacterium]|nr:restriction endonuclease [Spirochaetia bacterium]